jgi:hypothetical protein
MKFGDWDVKKTGGVNSSKDINKAVKMLVKGVQKKIEDYFKKDLPKC